MDKILDAIPVHHYLHVKCLAETNKLQFGMMEELFILLAENGKPLITSTVIKEVLDFIEKYIEDNDLEDLGYYCG